MEDFCGRTIRAVANPMKGFGVDLYITEGNRRYLAVAGPILMERKERESFDQIEPCITFDRQDDMQDLMDDLWRMGLRPSARSDEYKAQLESVTGHLNDMRALVFKDKKCWMQVK